MKAIIAAMIVITGLSSGSVLASFSMASCLLEQMNASSTTTTIGELKDLCLQLSKQTYPQAEEANAD